MSKKKVAFFVSGLNAGGTENYLLRFIIFYKNEIVPTVYCKSGSGGDLENEYLKAGATIVKRKLGYLNPIGMFRYYKSMRQNEFSAIVDLTGNFGGIPLTLARLSGIKVRIAFYRNADNKFKGSVFKNFYNWLIKKLVMINSTRIFSNSKAALDFFFGDNWINKRRQCFKVIYNGIDTQTFVKDTVKGLKIRNELGIPENGFVIGHVGRYNEQKNHSTILQVAKELCKHDSDIYFLLCGKNVPLRLLNTIVEMKLETRIFLLDVRRDVSSVLSSMNCFYFPSVVEGQPNALIEAMVVGLPIVASNISSIKETIHPRCHNQLVSPFDVDEASHKILEIKNKDSLMDGFNLSEWASNYYDAGRWFCELYKEI